jgi:hypothetical protein
VSVTEPTENAAAPPWQPADSTAGEYAPENCYYIAGCRWLLGCDAEAVCIGAEVEP